MKFNFKENKTKLGYVDRVETSGLMCGFLMKITIIASDYYNFS